MASKTPAHTALFQIKVSQITGVYPSKSQPLSLLAPTIRPQENCFQLLSLVLPVSFPSKPQPLSPSTLTISLLASSSTTRELGPLADATTSPVDIATHLSEATSKIPSGLTLPIFRSHHLQKIDVFVDSPVNLVSLNIRGWLQQQMATVTKLFHAY